MAMIYDCFLYNGEADILEIRLNVLKKHVDLFVIGESPITFSGKPKPLYYIDQEKRFLDITDKIRYYVVDDYPNDKELNDMAWSSPNVSNIHWHREFYQRESIKKAMVDFKDDDVCFIGDVDEIWNPNADLGVDWSISHYYKLRQIVYAYFLNNKSDERWAGTFMAQYKNIKDECINHLRSGSLDKIKDGGWHFTSIGGVEEMKRKIESYGHQEFNTLFIKDNLKNTIAKGQDFIGRNFVYETDESSWPKYLKDNREKYKHLCQ